MFAFAIWDREKGTLFVARDRLGIKPLYYRLTPESFLFGSEIKAMWPAGGISLALPTLLFDPFSSAFFSAIFPNIAPEMAGVFGGWMLVCCAGALLGVLPLRPSTPPA